MTAVDVRDELANWGFDMSKYANDLSGDSHHAQTAEQGRRDSAWRPASGQPRLRMDCER